MRRCAITIALVVVLASLLPTVAFAAGPHRPPSPAVTPDQFLTEQDYQSYFDPALRSYIPNPYLNLGIGNLWTYQGKIDRKDMHEQVIVKQDGDVAAIETIMGIPCLVVIDTLWPGVIQPMQDAAAVSPVEIVTHWYAQDKDGNVWCFGEDAAQYRNGVVVSHRGSWKAGERGAGPSVVMAAAPAVGDRYNEGMRRRWTQEWAVVLSTTETYASPAGAIPGSVLVRDRSRLDSRSAESKLYAPGLGLVRLEMRRAGSGVMELVAEPGGAF
jgi:hypothetical protein